MFDIIASIKCIRKPASHETVMLRWLMTKIIFLLKWWCWKVLAWMGSFLFVLHWDGNIEDVFKTELWLIIWWPHTETFCLAWKWACQPGNVTACVCLCMKDYWVSSGYSWDTVTCKIMWNTTSVSEYGTQESARLRHAMLSLFLKSHWHKNAHETFVSKHFFCLVFSPAFLSYPSFLSLAHGKHRREELQWLWYLSCIKHRNISFKN